MCGRYVSPGEADLERAFSLLPRWERLEPSYNVAPSQFVPVVRRLSGESSAEGIRLRWGLVPFFAKGVPPRYSTINARLETLATAASYRRPWARGQRCIQVAAGFYEWQLSADGRKLPYFIHLADREVFGFAGIWERSVTAEGITVESCAHITLPANDLLRDIHNAGSHPHRMPAILKAEDHETWLSGSVAAAQETLSAYPADLMVAYPVSRRVNAPKHNDADLILPIDRGAAKL
jgi:putative SOS response-associated peptidase YedK